MQADANRQTSSGVEGLLGAMTVQRPSGRQEARFERPRAVLSARRTRLWRQDACPEAVLGATGGPSGSRLGRQEARRRLSREPAGPSRGRLGRQEAENVGFADSSSENVGFADSSSENVVFA